MVSSHNLNLLVEGAALTAPVLTFYICFVISKKIMFKFSSYIQPRMRSKIANKYNISNNKLLEYICIYQEIPTRATVVIALLILSILVSTASWTVFRTFCDQMYNTYPSLMLTEYFYINLMHNLKWSLLIALSALIVSIIFGLPKAIVAINKLRKNINNDLEFYFHELETNEYLNNLTSSTNISIEQIKDAIDKCEKGLIEDSSFEKIRNYCLISPNSGFSDNISKQTTKHDLILNDLIDAYELKNKGFIDIFMYSQIKSNFIRNQQISANELNLLFEAIADGTVDMTTEEFASKKIQFLNSAADREEKKSDMKMILSVMQDEGIISKEEYKNKLNNYNK